MLYSHPKNLGNIANKVAKNKSTIMQSQRYEAMQENHVVKRVLCANKLNYNMNMFLIFSCELVKK